MDATVLAAHPGTRHEVRRDVHVPSVRIVGGGTRLATEIRTLMDLILIQALRSAPLVAQALLQHVAHQEGRLLVQHTLLLHLRAVDHLAILVLDAGDQYRGMEHTPVRDHRVGGRQLNQGDILRTQAEGRNRANRALDTHAVGSLDNLLRGDLFRHLHRHTVDRAGQGRLQRHRLVREDTAGVLRRPQFHLAILLRHPRDGAIDLRVAAAHALAQGLRVDEELERGARLAFRRHLIVLPIVEIDVAHPSLHRTRVRVHGDEATVKELQDVRQGVAGAHHRIRDAPLVIEDAHLMRLAQFLVDDDTIALVFLVQSLIGRCLLQHIIDEAWDLMLLLVAPRVLLAPVLVELFLQFAHLFGDASLRIVLHPGIDRRVDLQSVVVEVDVVLLAPLLQLIVDRLTEVVRITAQDILLIDVQAQVRRAE